MAQQSQESFGHELARKNFQLMVGMIVTCLTLVSLVASYSIYLESFADWPSLKRIFALLVTVGIEVAFIALVRGMAKALIEKEMVIAGFGAATLLIAMTINFVVHHAVVAGVPLSPWQQEWREWVGLVIPFYTIALFLVLSYISPESSERRQVRRMAFMGRQAALNFKEEAINSPETYAQLEKLRPAIGAEVAGHIAKSLPPAPASAQSQQRTVGFSNTPPPAGSNSNFYSPNSNSNQ